MAQTVEPKGTTGVRSASERGENSNSAGPSSAVVLGPRDSLVGKLTVEGDLTVRGTVDGELKVSGDVAVEHTATVKAKVSGRNVSIQGSVTGDLAAKNRLTVAGSGVVNGDVRVAKLQVEDGGTLNGNISMGAGAAEDHGKTG